jgi:predicted nucleic acid-binding protein
MSDRALVLDANILIRAVLGKRLREIIVDNADKVHFFHPMSPTLMHESTFPHC